MEGGGGGGGGREREREIPFCVAVPWCLSTDPGQVDGYTLFLPSPFLPLLPSFSPSPSHVISLCSMTIIV